MKPLKLTLNHGSNGRKCGERREGWREKGEGKGRKKGGKGGRGVRGVKRWTEGSELE